MKVDLHPQCARCAKVACSPRISADQRPNIDDAPLFCPMKLSPAVIEDSLGRYDSPDVIEFAQRASIQEFECYEILPEGRRTVNPRILELIQFSEKCGYKKLGLAFCAGLANEARMLTDVLENNGFTVVSVRCKVGAIPKERIGLAPEHKIAGPEQWETMCNPIAQAEILNANKVDLAIVLGLCIGHDTLFFQHCRVPITVLAVKDRVTGHNPLAALYLTPSYYSRLMSKPK